MTTYTVFNPQGATMGDYEGETARDAIEACVRDAGYESIEQMEATLGRECELEATEVRPA